ncbi:MAG TPA: hypothetical protein VMD92_08985 [Acidobacteriaceae bacterium]|nr:hypothetical protein [Acidobacteriaceae bacterium]
MNLVVTAALVSGLLAAGWQAASQSASPGSANTEQIEQGHVESQGGDLIFYRIRLLPVASFPDLPPPVAAQLRSRGCMIPQTFEAQAPENVIHGAFRSAGSIDWAALCSVDGSTTLYVFLAGQFDAPLALRSQPDTAWLGAEPGSNLFGSAWGIALRTAANLRASRQLHGAVNFDHDGIEDARLERSATVRYCQDGHWLALTGAQ